MSIGRSAKITPGNQGRTAARKDAIMDAATRLFREHGFHAAGTAELAQRAGLSIAQIYRDFGSKDGLILAIVVRACNRWLSAAEADLAIADMDSAASRRWIEALFDRSLNDDEYGLVPEMLAAATRSGEISRIMAKLDDDIATRLTATLGIVAPKAPSGQINEAQFLILSVIVGVATRRRLSFTDAPCMILNEARAAIARIMNNLVLSC